MKINFWGLDHQTDLVLTNAFLSLSVCNTTFERPNIRDPRLSRLCCMTIALAPLNGGEKTKGLSKLCGRATLLIDQDVDDHWSIDEI